jgi:hypothetical protein
VQARYAARVCDHPTPSAQQKLFAIAVLESTRARQHLPSLQRLLADESTFSRRGGGGDQVIQLRDVALAAAVVVTGQRPADYGFEAGYGVSGRPGGTTGWGYSGDLDEMRAKRAFAFGKWREWEATAFGATGGPAAGLAAVGKFWQPAPPRE